MCPRRFPTATMTDERRSKFVIREAYLSWHPNSAAPADSARIGCGAFWCSPPVRASRLSGGPLCATRLGGRIQGMKLVTGKVVDGKVTLPEGEFAEGSAVAVFASEAGEPVLLSRAEEDALSESLQEIRSGNFVDGEDLIRSLRARGR